MKLAKCFYVTILLLSTLTIVAFSQEASESTEVNYDNIAPESLLIIPVSKEESATLTSVWGRKVAKYFLDSPLPKLEVRNILIADLKIKSDDALIETYIKPNNFTLALLVEIVPTATSKTDFEYLVTLKLYHRFIGKIAYHTFLANMKTYLEAIEKNEDLEEINQQLDEQYELDKVENLNLDKISNEIRDFMTTDKIINWYTLQIVPSSDKAQKYNFNISLKEDKGEILDTIEATNTFMISTIDYPIQIFQEFPTGETILVKKFYIKKRNRDYSKKLYRIEVPAIPGTYAVYLFQEFNNQYYVLKPMTTDIIGGVAFPIETSGATGKKYTSTFSSMGAVQVKYSFQSQKLPLYVGGKAQVMASNIEMPTTELTSSQTPVSLIIDTAAIAQFGYLYSISGFDIATGIGLGMNIGAGPTWKRDGYTSDSSISFIFSTDLEVVYNIAKLVRVLTGTNMSVHHGDVFGTNDARESQSIFNFTNMFANIYGGFGIRY